ncbi:MFS transporter [Terriglobus albidus]|uniref:MFS transporter n=1 Tax=Terriglobus albidus TaxID=1592106 RepID=UPI0021E0203E|nr:MFS transporter [Terriglobus albidus]
MPEIAPKRSKEWQILLLLVLAMGICFIDRGSLSIALTSLKRDLSLDEKQLGLLSSAFFLSYTLMQLAVGKLLERFDAAKVFGLAFVVWSLATAATGLSRDLHLFGITLSGFAVLFTLRLILGCGESVSFPATSALITRLFPEELRGTANSLIDVGTKIGPALGIMAGTAIVAASGWRMMFLVLGLGSMLWIPLWFVATRSIRVSHGGERAWSPTYLQVAAQRQFWGAAIGHIGSNYAWSMFVSWLPYYFEQRYHYSAKQLVVVSSLPFWCLSVACGVAGVVSDRLVRQGRNAVMVRKATVCIGCIVAAISLFVVVASNRQLVSMGAMMIASFGLGLFTSNNWALTQSLAGPRAAAKWTSLQNLFANLSATLSAWLTGVTLAATHSFGAAFSIASAFLLTGTVFYWFVINARGQVTWEHEPESVVSPATP